MRSVISIGFWFAAVLSLAGLAVMFIPHRLPAKVYDYSSVTVGADRLVDIGLINRNQIMTFRFGIINPWDHTVVVEKIEATCGCTKVELMKSRISAQEMAIVKVEIKGPAMEGLLKVHVDLKFDNGESSRVSLFGLIK